MAELADATDSKSVGPSDEPQPPQSLNDIPKACGALGGARTLQNDPELAAVVNAWPTLPQAVKAGIAAMVKSVK